MNNIRTIYIILICIILCILILYIYNVEYRLQDTQIEIYKQFGYNPNSSKQNNIFIPSQSDNAEIEIDEYMKSIKSNKGNKYNNSNTNDMYINGIYNMDYLTSKRNMFICLNAVYNNDILNNLIPKTYTPNDIDKLNIDIDNDKIYILKRDDLQQQKGLILSNNKDHMKELIKKNRYAVIQEFLNNPFIIQDNDNNKIINRKINLRIYTFVIIKNGKLKVYIYKDGFVYYTPLEFIYCLNPSNMITTGYIDRNVYKRNPLT